MLVASTCVSHGEKIRQKRSTRSCAYSPWSCGLPQARSPHPCLVRGCSGSRNCVAAAEASSRSRHPVDVKASAVRLLLRCNISSHQSFKETSVQESIKRVTAMRVSDSAVWDDLIVTPPAESQLQKKMKNIERTCQSNSVSM